MNLELELNTHFAKVVGAPSVRYGQLSEEQARNEDLTGLMEMCVPTVVHEHLEKESGVQLDMVRPFSDKHDGMFAVYTNHDAEERFDVIEDSVGMESVANLMNEAMNHGEHKSRLLWWYDWDQLRVDLMTPARYCCSKPSLPMSPCVARFHRSVCGVTLMFFSSPSFVAIHICLLQTHIAIFALQ
ncbi:hypothetical protein C8Q76DRAFT_802088 [Earliella scabrosa]|nr:hypothetical protein C8Q76DRAFT_802088 [Earliella scabrosa]